MRVTGDNVNFTPDDWDETNARTKEEFEASQCRQAADIVARRAADLIDSGVCLDPAIASEIAAEQLSPHEDCENLCVKDEPQVIPGPSQ